MINYEDMIEKHLTISDNVAIGFEKILSKVKRYGKNVKVIINEKEYNTRELYDYTAIIMYPENKEIPEKSRWQTESALDRYAEKFIMGDIIPDGVPYTYGNLMRCHVDQVEKCIEKLSKCSTDRQATIMIGDYNCLNMKEPPCCRVVDFKIRENKLNMTLLFRSHDITAWPVNLWGFAKLQKYIADRLNVGVGLICCHSMSLHLYDGDCDLLGWQSFSI